MTLSYDICTLDYLVGTLSTAYKGAITSLAAKNFCITEQQDSSWFKGTVLSIPEGKYEASLIRNGIELSRTVLEHGHFELKTESRHVREARDLQIDIIQTGRHVGTFLLKKESSGGVYISAVELSGELKGMDLKLLTVPLQNKIGLLEKAEDIVSRVLSTKKDWADFSERMNGFIEDFFWSDRSAFYNAFAVLAHFSRKAAEQTDKNITNKPIANFLGCIALALEHDPTSPRLRSSVNIWLNELSVSTIDLSAQLHTCVRVLGSIHDVFPDAGIAPIVVKLIGAVRNKLFSMPTFRPSVFDHVRHHVSPEDYVNLLLYGTKARTALLQEFSEVERALKKGELKKVFSFFAGLSPEIFDDANMISGFFDAVPDQLTWHSAPSLSKALIGLFSLTPVLSSPALEKMKSDVPVFIQKLVSINREDLCESLLDVLVKSDPRLKEEIIMNPAAGKAILSSGNDELIARYVEILTDIVIPPATIREISTETWAEVVNTSHLDRLSKFMDILQLGADHSRPILVHLIANLYVSGVFIPDDRLFQRKVSAYLNSPAVDGDFLLNYLLLKKLPVYFNEVGAASRIRDYSTEIDSWGNDPVLYFVRKQVHVNASNYNVQLIEKLIRSWVFNDPSLLQNAIPPDVYANLKPELFERYSAALRPFFESLGVLDHQGLHMDELLKVAEKDLTAKAGHGQPDEVETKIMLLCRLYQEIVRKYRVIGRESEKQEFTLRLPEHLDRMKKLAGLFRSPEKTTASESLYFKRHIAFGIPSVLGTYHEPKFDAFAHFVRHDAGIATFLEETAAGVETENRGLTKEEFASRLRVLSAAHDVLKLHGLSNKQIEELSVIVDSNSLRLSQIADLLKIWQKELAWMVAFLSRTFYKAVTRVIDQIPRGDMPELLKNIDPDKPDFTEKAADIIIRDIIADVPGLMETDMLIERLLTAIGRFIEIGMDLILQQNPNEEKKKLFVIQELSDTDAMRLGPVAGGKAKNLAYLHNRGFSVPAAVVLSADFTEVVRERDDRDVHDLARQAVRLIEKRTGMTFGDSRNPLFLAVRSGSYISMPGILSTVLYCGMNRDTVQGLIHVTGDSRLAWDSYRRFIEHYSTVVNGLDMSVFEYMTNLFMEERGISELHRMDARDLEALVRSYMHEIRNWGVPIPEDVHEQLYRSVRAVYASWSGERAQQFRRATNTSGYWGTSVMLMQMAFANTFGSGASVFFTRNPATHEPEAYGETREAATGDELVYGRRLNRPISRKQVSLQKTRDKTGMEQLQKSLEEEDPELFVLHRKLADGIEQAMGGLPQEVEAVYVKQHDGRRLLSVLQTRRMEYDGRRSMKFDEICEMESRIVGRGTGAYGGALSGVASFAQFPDQAERLKKESALPVILLRTTANTGDVSFMPVIDGIITAAGGLTSHAAVLAQKFNVVAVVGCRGLWIGANEYGERYARVGETIIKEGSLISIDGSTGLVFSGSCVNLSPLLR